MALKGFQHSQNAGREKLVRIIELDGGSWRTQDDLYDALLPALGAPDWHGRNLDALIDSMGTGSINEIEPPYLIKIKRSQAMPVELRDILRDLGRYVDERAKHHLDACGEERVIHLVLSGDA
jgi:RNAse (barnase) inhibitor barstar